MIEIKCGSCSKVYKLPDETAGKMAKCKACGNVMAIPTPVSLDGLGGGGPALDDLSALYDSGSSSSLEDLADQGVDADLGFNPNVSFSSTPTKKSSSLPLPLLLGVGGGVLAVLIIGVIVIVILTSGSGNEDDGNNNAATGGGMALNNLNVPTSPNPGSVTSNFPSNTTPRDTGSETPGGDTAGNPSSSKMDMDRELLKRDSYLSRFEPQMIEYPGDTELAAWTEALDTNVGHGFNAYVFRGLSLSIPNFMRVKHKSGSEQFGPNFMNSPAPQFIKQSVSEAYWLQAKTIQGSQIDLFVVERTGSGPWPRILMVDQTSHAMVIGRDIMQYIESDEIKNDPQNRGFAGFVKDQVRKTRPFPASFRIYPPSDIFVHRGMNESIEFGTLFGGYRFARVQGYDSNHHKTHSVVYTGYLGDLQVVAHITAKDELVKDLEFFEGVLKTARLATREEAKSPSRKDERFLEWLDSSSTTVVYQDDAPPIADALAVVDDGPDETPGDSDNGRPTRGTDPQTPVVRVNLDGMVMPIGKPYAITLPDGFELASSSRVAIRTKPLPDGSWLTMEVHRLSSVDRRRPLPIDADKNTVLFRGHSVPMPDGVKVNELVAGTFTIQRLLYPEGAADQPRRVTYVIKDGAYLITVRGLYPASAADTRLEAFDKAVRSLQKSE